MSTSAKVAGAVTLVSHAKGDPMTTKKCPVCEWEINETAITVKIAGQDVTVCCQECADKLQPQTAGEGRGQ
jgi:hypothetical protein